jgi:hypothetical protein
MCAILVLVGILAFGGSTALGQAKKSRRKAANQPPVIKDGQSWIVITYSVAALAGVCVVAFKNPKRKQPD